MAKISSNIGKELYKIEIKSPTGNVVIADEPETLGGKDLGFSPNELLAASLAACTAATLRMYADRKGWDLTEVKIKINLEWDDQAKKTNISRELELIGNLDEAQKARLFSIAEKCPVHKMLSNPIEISTQLI